MRMIIFPFAFVDRIVNPILSKYVGLCVCRSYGRNFFLSCFFFPSFSIYALLHFKIILKIQLAENKEVTLLVKLNR